MILMTLAFAYVRASTIEEVRQGSNERQKATIIQYAISKGYELDFFEDRAKSREEHSETRFRKDAEIS